MLKNLFIWSRTIHRWTLWPTSILIILMSATGLLLKWPFLLPSRDLWGQVAHLHEEISSFFVISLVTMMGTGLYMYLFPKLLAKKR